MTGFGQENDVATAALSRMNFMLHIIKSLKSNGKGAVILPHGVLFRGNAEGNIRRRVIRQGFIKGIIGLPANLFYGTSADIIEVTNACRYPYSKGSDNEVFNN